MSAEAKLCLECGAVLRGRQDKKFCNDYCRNAYNNKKNTDANNIVRNINHTLRKNRKILEDTISDAPEEMKKTTRSKLLTAGFDFNYHTHSYTNNKGQQYLFVYEFGYLDLGDDWLLIVKRKQ